MKKLLVALTLVAGVWLSAKPVQAAAPNVATLFSSGTASMLVASGPGTLFTIHIASGNAGDYAVCYDTGSASGITGTLAGSSAVPELMRVFVSTSNITPGIPGSGYMPSSVPIVSFTNGLGCIQSAVQRTNIYYRQPN